MKIKTSMSRKVFVVINTMVLVLLAVSCIIPFINIIAVSLSDQISVTSGQVSFWPKGFTLASYNYILRRSAFWQAFLIAIERTALGTAVNLLLTTLTAYPLSKSNDKLLGRNDSLSFMAGLSDIHRGGKYGFGAKDKIVRVMWEHQY